MAFVYWIHKPEDIDFTASGYIGVTDRSVDERYSEHKRQAKAGSEYIVHRALRKYGDTLVVDTLLEGSVEYCYEVEYKLRPKFGIGYNSAVGGLIPAMSGMRHSDEAKRKISEATKGERHPLYGKPMTDEVKKKISLAQKGDKSHMFGKKLSEETKAKCAAWRVSNPHPFCGLTGWQLPKANKYVWSKAIEMYEYVLANPIAGIRKTAKHFNGPDSKWQKLYTKLKSGWNPSEDIEYLEWLQQYKLKEALNAET